ncbi:Multidrug and toxin extrusion protein 1 [Phytophthora cinnamomi]|uniref:Multidrug and toxin extrusion protein 1 n=1 Tax=Phytophthora cinnamomi TaxID=4785 RepID=UPI00355A7A28|nr:Multidrug and toxin extrusion protein 1 [Phytophthora cinnamomi]
MADGGAGRLDALVLKLRHPLAKIRSRALQSLLFKLRERLVRWPELEPLHASLVPALLASLEPPLELPALHVLQLLVQSQSELLLASLQRCGAAQALQRAANGNAELREDYEKLLRQIYVTKVAQMEENKEQVSNSAEEGEEEEEKEDEEIAAQDEKVRASRVLADRRRAPKVDELEARGWRFAQVALTSVDEQFLFEFEVKLQLRTEVQDLVAACAMFRNELLRNFPAEVFLQRPTALQYLLHLLQQPILPGSPGTTIATSVRVNDSTQGDLIALEYLSAALWSLVYDNQKARALLLSKPTALRNLQQILTSQQAGSEQIPGAKTSSDEIVENLRRMLMLLQESISY